MLVTPYRLAHCIHVIVQTIHQTIQIYGQRHYCFARSLCTLHSHPALTTPHPLYLNRSILCLPIKCHHNVWLGSFFPLDISNIPILCVFFFFKVGVHSSSRLYNDSLLHLNSRVLLFTSMQSDVFVS